MTAIASTPVGVSAPRHNPGRADAGRPPTDAEILASLRGPIDPIRTGPLYQLGMLAVAVTMLVLPLIYLGLVCLVAYGVYWHAVNDVTIFEGSGNAKGKLLVYVAPIVVGGVLVLFMIKPLFAGRPKQSKPMSLRREDEPLLFAFVDQVADVVGARRPARIDVDTRVNASASFPGGVFSLLGTKLVLTIGLPLVAGLSMRQFAGVLAHEFGHFAQGSGMRLTFIVRSVNAWFARVVYERDAWDENLANLSKDAGHYALTLLVLLARFFVWLTRRVLWVLMWVGHGVSSFMLRQMEYDADRYEAGIAGCDTFASTFDRLAFLNVASQAAFSDLGSAWRERRLCDDFPALVRFRETDLSADIRNEIRQHSSAGRTGWFDSHPCDASRIACARRESRRGIFTIDAPASRLFRDFEEACRCATIVFYQEMLGGQVKPENLVTTDSLVQSRGQRHAKFKAMRRFFRGLADPTRMVFPGHIPPPPADRSAAGERLLELRGQLMDAAPEALVAVKRYDEADGRILSVSRARTLRAAGVSRLDAKAIGLTRVDESSLAETARASTFERTNAKSTVDAAIAAGVERLRLALSLEKEAPPPVPVQQPAESEDFGTYEMSGEGAGGAGREDDALINALRAIYEASLNLDELRREFIVLDTVLRHLKPEQNSESMINTVLRHSRRCVELLNAAHQSLHGACYPYDHADGQLSLSRFASPGGIPPSEQVGDVHEAAQGTLESSYSLYVRLMSDLAERAEKVEADLGLPPMEDPPEEEEQAESQTASA